LHALAVEWVGGIIQVFETPFHHLIHLSKQNKAAFVQLSISHPQIVDDDSTYIIMGHSGLMTHLGVLL